MQYHMLLWSAELRSDVTLLEGLSDETLKD